MPSGTVTSPADSTAAQTVTVATLDDARAEDDETFPGEPDGSGLPARVSLVTSTATGTITDDESLTGRRCRPARRR